MNRNQKWYFVAFSSGLLSLSSSFRLTSCTKSHYLLSLHRTFLWTTWDGLTPLKKTKNIDDSSHIDSIYICPIKFSLVHWKVLVDRWIRTKYVFKMLSGVSCTNPIWTWEISDHLHQERKLFSSNEFMRFLMLFVFIHSVSVHYHWNHHSSTR